MSLKSNVDIIIADDDCFTLRGVIAMLHDYPGFSIAAMAGDFQSLCLQAAVTCSDVIILESGLATEPDLNDFFAAAPASIILHEHSLGAFHYQCYLQQTVQAIVLKRQQEQVLLHAIREVYARRQYYCPQATKFFNSYPVYGKGNKPLFSSREVEVLQYLAADKSNREIGQLLFSSPHTIESVRKTMMKKAGTKSTAALLCFAARQGFLAL